MRRPARPEKPLTKATTNAETTSISTIPPVPAANGAPPVKIPATCAANPDPVARCR